MDRIGTDDWKLHVAEAKAIIARSTTEELKEIFRQFNQPTTTFDHRARNISDCLFIELMRRDNGVPPEERAGQ